MLDNVVKDKYERPILSLRITLTNRCNVNCLYCHHDGMVKSKDEMTADEVYTICKVAKNIGVQKIRLSGGEPLLKKDIVETVQKFGSLDFKDISMTTNGILLEKYAEDLKKAGLNAASFPSYLPFFTASSFTATRLNFSYTPITGSSRIAQARLKTVLVFAITPEFTGLSQIPSRKPSPWKRLTPSKTSTVLLRL